MTASPSFRILLAQLEVAPGDPEANVRRMVELIAAHAGEADLIAFPEMAVPGYLVGDLWLDGDWCEWMTSFNATLQRASAEHRVAVLYGNVFLPNDGSVNKDGRRRRFNAAYLFQNGVAVPPAIRALRGVPDSVQPKTLLPNYRFFDDERYFLSFADQAADDGVALERACQPFALEWKPGRALNTARLLKANGAEAIVNISSSPWTFGKNAARDRRIEFLQGDGADVPFLYVNRTGAENCGDNIIVYDGGTTAYGADGTIRAIARTDYREDVLRCSICEGENGGGGVELCETAPLTRPAGDKIARKHEAIRRGLRHVAAMTGRTDPKFLIGLSGGVDSAVVAALLVDTFGQDSLLCLTMPSRHTSEATLANARHVAEALGVPLETAPIDRVVDRARAEIDAIAGPAEGTLAHENEQARIRGAVFLAGLAARQGRLFPNNGNKVETALGYATLLLSGHQPSSTLMPAAAFDESKTQPKQVVLAKDSQSDKYGEVAFNHETHSTKNYSVDGKTGITCTTCHHTDQPKANLKPPFVTSERTLELTTAVLADAAAAHFKNCRTCHLQVCDDSKPLPTITDGTSSKPIKVSNEIAYHANCNVCHDAAVKVRPDLKGKIPGTNDCAKCHKPL